MIANALGPVFLLILFGALLRRINFPGAEFWPGIEKLGDGGIGVGGMPPTPIPPSPIGFYKNGFSTRSCGPSCSPCCRSSEYKTRQSA